MLLRCKTLQANDLRSFFNEEELGGKIIMYMIVLLLTFMFSAFILIIITSNLSIQTFCLLLGANILLHMCFLCLLSSVAVKSFEFRLSNFIEGNVLLAFPKNYEQVSASQMGNEFSYAALLIEPNIKVVKTRVITFGEMLSSLQSELPFIYSFVFSLHKRRKYCSLLHPVIPCGVYAVVSLDETTTILLPDVLSQAIV